MKSFNKKQSIDDVKQKHTIFAINSPILPHKIQTSMDASSMAFSGTKFGQKSLYNTKNSQNNWLNPMELLSRKHKFNGLQMIQSKGRKKQDMIRKLEKQIPGMKTQSTINSTPINYLFHHNNQISFNKAPRLNRKSIQKSQQKNAQFQFYKNNKNGAQNEKSPKIRKISVLSLSSTKSLNESPAQELAYVSKSQPKLAKYHRAAKPNIFAPITTKEAIINEDLQNSHYNNQKYYKNNKQKAHTEPDVMYSNEIIRLKKQLQKSQNIITNMKIKQLENEIDQLKQKDKKYESIIQNLIKNKERREKAQQSLEKRRKQLQKQISEQKQQRQRQKQRQRQREREKEKERQRQKQRQKQKQKQRQIEKLKQKQNYKIKEKQRQKIKSLQNDNKSKAQTSKNINKIMIPRSKTQMGNQLKPDIMAKSSDVQEKKYQIEDQTYHVLADHSKEIESQKQFLLINPIKTREKLQLCYSQLRRQNSPQITINPFRIPKIPKPPRHDQDVLDYISLARELCHCLNFQIEQVDIVIKRYKNCISFKVLGTNDIVIWNFDGRLFVGGWKETTDGQGKKVGKGMEFTDSYCFKGQFADGKRSGQGTIQHYNGSVYEGEWRNGKMDGKGIFFDKANSTYFQGQWDKGQQRGRGVIKYTKKHYYTGEFKNFSKSGKGTQFFENGDIYQGSFDKGEQNGHGIYYYQSGEFYVGNFLNSKKQGTGLYLSNKFSQIEKRGQKQKIQQYYYGQFNKGKQSGYGIFRKLDGTYFFGYFYNNLEHGPGIMQSTPYFGKNQSKHQLKITGIWRNGELAVTKKSILPSEKTESRQFSENNN